MGRIERAIKWVKRNPIVTALSCLVMLALMAGTTISTLYAIEANHQAYVASQQAIAESKAKKLAEEREAEALAAKKLAQNRERQALLARIAERKERQRAMDGESKANWNLYVARMYPLMAAWKKQDYGDLQRLLNESIPKDGEPDFRGWEWYYFQDQCRQASTELKGSGVYYSLADWCHKTNKIAIPTRKRTIDIWDGETMKLERTLPAQTGWITRIDWSPQGDRIGCYISSEKRVVILNLAEEKPPVTFNAHAHALAWTDDGQRLATGGGEDAILRIWNTNTGELLETIPTANEGVRIVALDWHADGVRIAIGQRHCRCTIWDTQDKKALFQFKKTSGEPVYSVAWSPDGKKLAAGTVPKVQIWEEKTEAVITGATDAASVNHIAWNPEGTKLLSTGSGHHVTIFDVNTEKVEREIRVHRGGLKSLHCGPNGEHVLTGSAEIRLSPLAQTDLSAKKLTGLGRAIYDVSWNPQGDTLACAGSFYLGFVEAKSDRLRKITKSNSSQCVSWSPNGKLLATLGYHTNATAWDAETDEKVQELKTENLPFGNSWDVLWDPQGKWVAGVIGMKLFVWKPDDWEHATELLTTEDTRCLACSPDGKTLVSGGHYGMKVWDTTTWDMKQHIKSGSVWHAMNFSPDGKVLAVGRTDLLFYRTEDWKLIHKAGGHQATIMEAQFSPNGRRIATACQDGTIRIWDAATAANLVTIDLGVRINCIKWSPDGRQLACGRQDGIVQIWGTPELELAPSSAATLETGVLSPPRVEPEIVIEPIQQYEGHKSSVTCVAVSPDGQLGASVSGWPKGDGTLWCWNLKTGQVLWHVPADQTLSKGVAFTPDGKALITGGAQGVLRVWETNTGRMRKEIHVGWNIQNLKVLPDGEHVTVAGTGGVEVWNLGTSRLTRKLAGIETGGRQMDVAISGDGKRLISADEQGAIHVWNIQTGKEVLHQGELPAAVESVSLNQKGTRAVVALRSNLVMRISIENPSERELLHGHQGVVHMVRYSPDDRCFLSTSRDKTVRLWDANSGEVLAEFVGHTDSVMSAAFTPDGKQILSGGGGIRTDKGYEAGYDHTLRLWKIPDHFLNPQATGR